MGKDCTDDMITSSANQQMKHLSQLMKRAKERKKEQVFVVEGIKMFQEAPADTVVSVYVSESFLEKPEHEKCLQGYRYEVVSDAVFREISDTQTPQGILAIVRMPKYDLPDLLQGDHTHLLILESVQDPGNLGTIVRTSEGAGMSGVIMSRECVDLFNPKVVRSTMGAIFRVPFCYVQSLTDVIDRIKSAGCEVFATAMEGSEVYDQLDYTKGAAFIIGNEANGVSDEVFEKASKRIRIPMEGKLESLNAAVSAAIIMYEIARQKREK